MSESNDTCLVCGGTWGEPRWLKAHVYTLPDDICATLHTAGFCPADCHDEDKRAALSTLDHNCRKMTQAVHALVETGKLDDPDKWAALAGLLTQRAAHLDIIESQSTRIAELGRECEIADAAIAVHVERIAELEQDAIDNEALRETVLEETVDFDVAVDEIDDAREEKP